MPTAGNSVRRAFQWVKKRDALRRERVAFERARLVITNSDLTSLDVHRAIESTKDKIVRIWFGAALAQEATQPRAYNGPFLLFVGALGWDMRKGLDIALKALARLSLEPSFKHRLLVAGFGSTRPWQKLAKELRISERVEFLSFVEDVPALLAAADLVLSPARYEPYGLAIQEAIMEGVPALVSAGGIGILDRLPKSLSDLSVAEPEDPESWARSIRHVLRNLGDFRERTRAAAAMLGARNWDTFADEFIDVVESRLATQLGRAVHGSESAQALGSE